MKKILFILPGFGYGGTPISTLNMIMFLKEQYDIALFPMRPYGPVRKKYEEAGVNILPSEPSIVAVRAVPTKEEPDKCIRRKINFYKSINHLCLNVHIDFQKIVF